MKAAWATFLAGLWLLPSIALVGGLALIFLCLPVPRASETTLQTFPIEQVSRYKLDGRVLTLYRVTVDGMPCLIVLSGPHGVGITCQ